MLRLPLAALLAATAALPALAQPECPTRADIDGGIRLDMGDGVVETYRPLRPGVIRVTGEEAGGETYRIDLAKGLYTLAFQDVYDGRPDPAARTTHAFEMRPENMPDPAPGSRVSLDVVTVDFGEFLAETEHYDSGPLSEVTIGTCRYDAFEVVARYSEEPGYEDGFLYLPELGISYLAWWREGSEREDLPVVSIAAVR
ncbi:hypothetical protein OG2516_14336 [Oceanicola granulosus HTCC2516]|uniref:DUF4198 domain-containing protein n=1 Tax=Oceanicola granulosus (strain ATCC BAA-861 / DSM 15982 / KCTC 12143 / HTCC2516) TaxID=314256 RepID=Q2CB10_OCEGH|nr:hypothetical protein [Oceanicola granulosus]EAR49866.1 hypothetical protein OG2516_14336 [Oceanicola granulosus HTCC2516]